MSFSDDEKISGLTAEQMRSVRGSKIGFIFQDPMTSLNPLFTVEHQLTETIHAEYERYLTKKLMIVHCPNESSWDSSA